MVKVIVLGVLGLAAAVVIGGLVFERLCEMVASARYKPPGQMVMAGGHRLSLVCKGAAAGPTIVIEQGLFSPSILWWPVQDRAAQFARVCTYDRAGYMWSEPAGANRSMQDRVSDLHALLTLAGQPKSYVLVGHSYGGLLIRLFARDYPDEVGGMVLVDAGPEGVLFKDKVRDYFRQSVKSLDAGVMAARFGLIRLGNPLFDQPIPGLSSWAQAAMKALTASPRFYIAMQDDMRSIADASPDLRAPGAFGTLGDKPLIVIAHGIPFPPQAGPLEDGWREGQERLATLSSDSKFVVAEKSNHQIFLDEPDLVVDAIKRVYEASRDQSRLK